MTLSHPILSLPAAALLALALGGPAAAQQTATEPEAEAETPAADTAETAEANPLAGLSADTVIATVGDYELTLGELIAVRQALPAQYQALPPEVLKEGLLEQLVNQTVLAVRARQEGYMERTDVRLALRNLENSTLADAYLREEIRSRVTPEALDAAYAERYGDAEPQEEINAAHILVDSEEKAAAIRAEAEAGAEFAALAAEHGTDGTANRGGDLGWFVEGDMVPEFSEAAFALETGVISEPVQSPFGWHLILVKERRERAAPPIEEVREELVRALAEEAQQAAIDDARAAVGVTLPEEELPAAALLADGLLRPEAE